MEATGLRALGVVARALPFEQASDLGAVLGAVAFRALGRRRRIAIENVSRSLGPSPGGLTPEEVVRRAFSQLGRTFLEFLALPALRPEEFLARVEFDQFGPIEELARVRKGAVLVTGHFGNWEFFGAAAGFRYAPMKYLLPRQTNPWSDDYLNGIRRSVGIEPFVIGTDMRAAVKALRAGSFLGMLPDQDARRAGIHVPFFGRPASTHAGPARLALAAGVPLLVGVMERAGRGRFRARLLAVLEPDPVRDRDAEVLRLTAEMTQALERAIRDRPDHWYWIHRRWKTPPPEEPERMAVPALLRT